ncbi:MAG: amino acid ABC transporter permease [Parvibaculaceae bacterium]|nr:amino acid ABC transporter permease [Parvibaculaceae bacterium]
MKEQKASRPVTLGWSNPKFRGIVYQLLMVLCLGAIIWVMAGTAIENLHRLGIASGFGFLNQPAGFSIIMSLVPYSEQSTYGDAFIVGLLNTLLVAVIGVFFALIIGFTVGIARLSGNWLVARLAAIYVETLRNIPLLLQLFFWYIGVLRAMPKPAASLEPLPGFFLNNRGIVLPHPYEADGFWWFAGAIVLALLIGAGLRVLAHRRQKETGQIFSWIKISLLVLVILPLISFVLRGAPLHFEFGVLSGLNFKGGLRLIPEFVALTLGLATYTAAFIAEIVRSGIESVDRGQREAAQALGLTRSQTLRHVIVPQSMRVIVPPLTSQILNLMKNSSLAVAIGYPDLVSVFAGTVLNQTGQAVEVIVITMAVYLLLSFIASGFMGWFNSRYAIVER